jgi:hypothetical protein
MTRYWFKPKRYGYGATPVTWEGWAVTIAVAATVIVSLVAMQLLADRTNALAWLAWAALVAGITFGFVRLTRRKTEGEWRWHWGEDPAAPER